MLFVSLTLSLSLAHLPHRQSEVLETQKSDIDNLLLHCSLFLHRFFIHDAHNVRWFSNSVLDCAFDFINIYNY